MRGCGGHGADGLGGVAGMEIPGIPGKGIGGKVRSTYGGLGKPPSSGDLPGRGKYYGAGTHGVDAATHRISSKLDEAPVWFSGVGNERVGNARGCVQHDHFGREKRLS